MFLQLDHSKCIVHVVQEFAEAGSGTISKYSTICRLWRDSAHHLESVPLSCLSQNKGDFRASKHPNTIGIALGC